MKNDVRLGVQKKMNPGFNVVKIEGHSFFSEHLIPSSILVDFGTNKGVFSKTLISKFGVKSYGVEAEEGIYRNYLLSIDNLKVLNAAITNFNGKSLINRNLEHCSTIIESNLHETDGSYVDAITYDDFSSYYNLSEIDLIKFDIEGSEIEVFASCTDEQILNWKQITIEFHDFIFPELSGEVFKIRERLRGIGFQEIRFSLDNTDVVYLNTKYFRTFTPMIFVSIICFKYFRGFKRRYLLN